MATSVGDKPKAVISKDVVEATIEHFTKLDKAGDKRTMNKLARRLGREQPALLQYAATFKDEHGETTGEAVVFYCTLVWAMFDRALAPRKLPRLTAENLEQSAELVAEELGKIADLEERAIPKRYSDTLAERQPDIYDKLEELLVEDIGAEAVSEDTAAVLFQPAQVVIEAFDAAIDGRRPGERQGPIVRIQPKIGRNELCPCGSGKKYKKCCGRAA
ncbi:MAG: SEC-C metal-binding domain-containing protein [Myxococcota bacterium]